MPPPAPAPAGPPPPLPLPPPAVPPSAFYVSPSRAGSRGWVPPAFRGGAARAALVASLAADSARRIQSFPTQAAAVAAAAGANAAAATATAAAAAAAVAIAPVRGRRHPVATASVAAGHRGGEVADEVPGEGPPLRRRRLGLAPPPAGRNGGARPCATTRDGGATDDVAYDDAETVLFAVEIGADGRRRYMACTRLSLWRRYAARLARGLAVAATAAPTAAPATPTSAAEGGGGNGGRDGNGGGGGSRSAPAPVEELPLHVYEVIPPDVPVKLYFDLEFCTAGGLNAGANGRSMVAALLRRVGAALDVLRSGRGEGTPSSLPSPSTPPIVPGVAATTGPAVDADVAAGGLPSGRVASTPDAGVVMPPTAAGSAVAPAAAKLSVPPSAAAQGGGDGAVRPSPLPVPTAPAADAPWYLAGAVYLDSSTPAKFSAHLVLPAVVFPSTADAGQFVKGVVAAAVAADEAAGTSLMLVNAAPPPTPSPPLPTPRPDAVAAAPPAPRVPFCDTSVYTRNRCFRLVGSSKFGRRARLLPAPLPLPSELSSSPLPPPSPTGDASTTGTVMGAGTTAVTAGRPRISRALFFRSLITAIPTWPPVAIVSTGVVHLGGPPTTTAVGGCHLLAGAAAATQGGGLAPRGAPGLQVAGSTSLPPYPRLTAHIQALVAPGGAPTGGAGTVRSAVYFTSSSTAVYSIGGGYRLCGRIGRHHRSNGVYFVVDVPRQRVTQRCYDADCAGWMSPPVALDAALFEQGRRASAEGEEEGGALGGTARAMALPPPRPPGRRWEPDADERAALEVLAAEDLSGLVDSGDGCGAGGGGIGGPGGMRGPSRSGRWEPDANEHAALAALAVEDLSTLWGEERAAATTGAGGGHGSVGTAPSAASPPPRRRWEPDAAERAALLAVAAEDIHGLWGVEGAAGGCHGVVSLPPPPLRPPPPSPPPPPSERRPDDRERAALAALAADAGASGGTV